MAHMLASLQATLSAASKTAWAAIEADLRARPPLVHGPGARLLVIGLDPTRQTTHVSATADRAILTTHKDERFLVALDAAFNRRLSQLRHLQTLFGWPIGRESAWNAVAEIVETRALEPIAEDDPTREHDLRLLEIYVPEQLLLAPPDDAPPGLDAAVAELDRLQGGPAAIAATREATSPEALVARLPQILGTHDWRSFQAMCDDSLGATEKRMAFEQFRQAWDAGASTLAFDGYEGPAASGAADGDVVRTRLRRSGPKAGEVWLRPLRWVKRGAAWRYLGGIL